MNYEDRVTKEYVEGLLAGMPKNAYGSYTGIDRGNMQLNFSFTPKFIAITGRNGYAGAAVVAEGSGLWNTYIIGGNNTAVGGRPTYTLSGGRFYLQHENNVAAYALNENNVVYYYLAIG